MISRTERTSQPALRVVEPGLLATVQDLGRPGLAALGVAPSGALDRGSARTANRLVGNPEGAAVIEVTMGGLRVVALRDLWFAVAGAWGPIRLAGHEVDPVRGARLARGRRAAPRLVRARRTRVPRGARRHRCPDRCWARARPTCWRASVRPGCAPATSWRSATSRATRSRSPTSHRGVRRTTTSSRSISRPGRGATGSRHPPTAPCSRRSGPSRTTPTGSACAWTARFWPASATTSCRARAWCPARCRCRRAGGRRSCSPTAR